MIVGRLAMCFLCVSEYQSLLNFLDAFAYRVSRDENDIIYVYFYYLKVFKLSVSRWFDS